MFSKSSALSEYESDLKHRLLRQVFDKIVKICSIVLFEEVTITSHITSTSVRNFIFYYDTNVAVFE